MAETSGGRALAERYGLELDWLSELTPHLRKFLVEVEALAVESIDVPDGITASAKRGERFTEKAVRRLWGKRLKDPIEKLTKRFLPDPTDPYVKELIKRANDSDIPRRLHGDIREVLVEGRKEGWGRRRLTRELNKIMEPVSERHMNAAKRLIQTETTALYNYNSLQQLAREGFKFKKWVSRLDEKTRTTHRHSNGEIVKIGQKFTVGGAGLLIPGDPRGPYKETANCRCVIVGVRKAEGRGY